LKFCTSLGATFSGADKVLANTIDQRQTEQRIQKQLLIAQTNRKKKKNNFRANIVLLIFGEVPSVAQR
jgi:hypothetical protein